MGEVKYGAKEESAVEGWEDWSQRKTVFKTEGKASPMCESQIQIRIKPIVKHLLHRPVVSWAVQFW